MGKRTNKNPPADVGRKDIDAKKHKKHSKHRKHKKKKSDNEEGKISDVVKSPIKATGEEESSNSSKGGSSQNKVSLASSSSSSSASEATRALSQIGLSPKQSSSSKKKKKKGKDSGTSSEEERWLDAIESGKLEEVDDELKKIKPKDPNLMTARQRAMFERKTDKDSPAEHLFALPSGYKEKVMTEEMVQKAAIKSQKRKQQADEKREKDKKKTMDRLLRKKESKSGKSARGKNTKREVPLVIYRMSAEGTTITFPPDLPDIPLKVALAPPPPVLRFCAVDGCKNPRKYDCSKTGVALCSLSCYKKNLEMFSSSLK